MKHLNEFEKYVSKNRIVSSHDLNDAISFFNRTKYKKGDFFNIHSGENGYMGYLECGLVQYYIFDEKGTKQVVDILNEGDWIAHFISTKLSQVKIEFKEDSVLWLISEKKMLDLCGKFPKIAEFKSKVILSYLSLMTEQSLDRVSLSAEERYLKFIKLKGSIINRITQNDCASYLGIKPQSLSRIKKNLMP